MANAKKSPKQLVADAFGSREELVKAIVKLTDGDSDEKSRLMGTTNKKLLRIHQVANEVNQTFGGKDGLIDAMEKLAFSHTKSKKANDGWREKMEGYTVKRLLDMHRQLTTRKVPNA